MLKFIRLLYLCLFGGMVMCACSDDNEIISPEKPVSPNTPRVCKCPEFLQSGDKIAIVSPSYVTDEATLERGMEAVRTMGFEPVLAPNVNKTYLVKYAGSPSERAADLAWAYSNQDVKAIMVTRGGYGAIQLLPLLDATLIQSNPKWLIGYSDITTLLSFSVAFNVMAIHGTMLSSLKVTEGKSEDDILLKNMLLGSLSQYEWASAGHVNRTGKARGVLVGGNMCTFTPLVGSPYDFTSQGDIILFVEEVGENARNIDRMMYALKLHGVLSRVKGILVGSFDACGDDFNIGSIEEMLSKYTLSDVTIPIAYGFPAGHAGVNWPLIEGAVVTMNVETTHASLSFDIATVP